MKKEYILTLIVGLFMLSYLLDAINDPLPLNLAHPYQYLQANIIGVYPFSTASIMIRAVAMFLTPLLFLSLIEKAHAAKALTLLIVSVLAQLYAVQGVATDSRLIPFEWAISLAFAGAALLLPMLIHTLQALFFSATKGIQKTVNSEALGGTPDWLEEER